MSDKQLLQQIRQVVREEVFVSEKRQGTRFRKILKEELGDTEQRIYRGVGDVISDSIFEMIEEKADKSDVEKLDSRVRALEQNTPILHQIKKK